MAETRISYHKEVKTASFQGRTITLENLTPILSPKAQDKRKREMILSISVDTFNSKICGTYATASRAAKNL